MLINSKNLSGSKKTFISYANGSPINRSFIAACRLANLKTIGLSHGNPVVLVYNTNERIFHDSFSISDKVYLNSSTELSDIKKQMKKYKKIIKIPKLFYPTKKKMFILKF